MSREWLPEMEAMPMPLDRQRDQRVASKWMGSWMGITTATVDITAPSLGSSMIGFVQV
jgi:hypothetical protein